jgi:DNA mismatch endonuclease, patch repair protein
MCARRDVYHPTDYCPPGRSWASSDAIRRTMLRNRDRNSAPELALRSAAHRAGLRYRLWQKPLPGVRRTADLVFPRVRVAVFLDGCFWHACPEHFVPPKTNSLYWQAKIEANRKRDADTDRLLAEAGWTVVRVWEHQDPLAAAARIAIIVRGAPKDHKGPPQK